MSDRVTPTVAVTGRAHPSLLGIRIHSLTAGTVEA